MPSDASWRDDLTSHSSRDTEYKIYIYISLSRLTSLSSSAPLSTQLSKTALIFHVHPVIRATSKWQASQSNPPLNPITNQTQTTDQTLAPNQTFAHHAPGDRQPFRPTHHGVGPDTVTHGAGNSGLEDSATAPKPPLPPRGEGSHGASVVPDTYRNGATVNGVDERSTGAKVKGVAAAIHGAGEVARGTFNREVDRAFGDVRCPFYLFSGVPTPSATASLPPTCSSTKVSSLSSIPAKYPPSFIYPRARRSGYS